MAEIEDGGPALGITDRAEISIKITGIEIVALKKLSLVSHALAERIGGAAGREQACIAGVLDDVIRQIHLGVAKLAAREGQGGGS